MAEAEGAAAAPGAEVAAESTLAGLGAILEKDEAIRRLALQTGRLLQWPSAAITGVINFTTMAFNFKVLYKVLEFWCPKVPTPKTFVMEDVRDEVLLGKKHVCIAWLSN